MRVSLTAGVQEGTCSKCGAGPALVLVVVVDDHCGETEALCAGCLFHRDGTFVYIPMAPSSPDKASRKKGLRKAKKTSQKQEQDIAEEYGGRTQPGSGNQPGAKGDIRKKGELRIEAKFTTASSFSLKLDELYKIAGEATGGELPALFVDYLESGTRKRKDRFVVLQSHDFKELLDASRKHR